MSFAGLKKQFNKANQYMSEKIGGAKGTELDDEFIEMERKTDVMGKLVDEVMIKTHEFLQPNPASRAKLVAVNSISKLRGQSKHTMYPQPEGTLGETMLKYGKELGEETPFGSSLVEAGEAFKQLGESKYALEFAVKQNFLDPLDQLQNKDLKEVNHHRKKLSGRRLDYDCKRRKKEKGGSNVGEEEIRISEEKFEESKELTETAMHNLLENDVEQVAQLISFIQSQMDYHRQAADVLSSLMDTLEDKRNEAASKPRTLHIPKRVSSGRRSASPSPMYDNDSDTGSYTFTSNNPPSYSTGPTDYDAPNNSNRQKACCKALYDFEPENEGELGFKEGDILTLTSRIDENWFEGSINGVSGFFPQNYVEVLVDL
ncbi:endophilin-A3-like isoform X2 [Liolophura sinensis]|uniref:endophilin-A3-like isoform X2 n=1 Tax=Liolophura sinensis TaxID=3198878 RepID=UPI003158D1D2